MTEETLPQCGRRVPDETRPAAREVHNSIAGRQYAVGHEAAAANHRDGSALSTKADQCPAVTVINTRSPVARRCHWAPTAILPD